MSRYIKFDDAVKVMACEMYAEAQSQGYDVDGIEDFMSEVKAWLNDAPSIDIVRCKECKWRGEQTESGIPYYWCRLVGVGYEVPIEHYCSYGEREGE